MPRKKKEEPIVIEEVAVEEVVEEVVEELPEELPEVEVVETAKDDPDLVGQQWEMTSHKIVAVLEETDTYYVVQVSDGCTYHLVK